MCKKGPGEADLKLDPEISTWILEFLIRQPVPDRLISKLLLNGAVPVPTSPRLKRAILLRAIDSDLANGDVSESTLDMLEALARMGRVGPALGAGYCAAAAECAVRYLLGSPAGKGRGRYLEAVERVWRVRVGELEAAGSGLVGDEIREWREEVEAAVWDPAAARRLVERNTRNEAVRLVREYLEEALAEMGPPFLEVVASELKERNVVVDGGDSGNVGPRSDPVDDREAELCADASRPPEKEVQKTGDRRCRRKRGAAIIVEPEEEEEEIGTATGSKYDTLHSAEVKKVKEALKSSYEELHVMVKDPLPSALNIAERLAAKMGERVVNGVNLNEKQRCGKILFDPVANTSTYVVAQDVPGHDRQVQSQDGKAVAVAAIPSSSHQRDAPKQSLMERNGTAHVYKWEDSINDSPDSTTRSVRHRLDTPENQAASPLKKYVITKFTRRRPRRKWSIEEEDALREAVRKFGKGNWKFILNSRLDVFLERTEVDLKDKWRNMNK